MKSEVKDAKKKVKLCNRRKGDLINLHENWVTEPLWGMMIAFLTLDFNYDYIIDGVLHKLYPEQVWPGFERKNDRPLNVYGRLNRARARATLSPSLAAEELLSQADS